MNPIVRISRNMAILRDDDGLTLVSPIRLGEAGERALEALGTVKRLVRLGAMHGVDDPFRRPRRRTRHVSRLGCPRGGAPGGRAHLRGLTTPTRPAH